ncbi:MAG: hypothetical protein JNL98_41465 [Bryobacterales bacterium]|nr:hypothetical protein [Bryobacterales bacterium]
MIRSLYSAMNANGDPDSFPYNTSPYFSDVPFYDYNNPDLTPNGHPAFKYIQRMK